MFWSDFHNIQGVPSEFTNTRGSMDPPWSIWQMIGRGWAVNGPLGELAKAPPMHCVWGRRS
jgi:hypothetical protein